MNQPEKYARTLFWIARRNRILWISSLNTLKQSICIPNEQGVCSLNLLRRQSSIAISIESERQIRINSEDNIATNPKTPRTPSGNLDSNLIYKKKSFCQLLKTSLGLLLLKRQNLLRLIGFTIQWTVGLFIFTILTINIQQLGLSSININGIFVGVAGMFGAGLVIFMITKIRRYVCGFFKYF
jgi:hypothetical protein